MKKTNNKNKNKKKNLEILREFANLLKEQMAFEKQTKRILENYKIGIEMWRETHPEGVKSASDKFYADLAEKIRIKLASYLYPPSFPDEFTQFLALAVTAYLEDLKSGVGVWDALRSLYRERYGAWLPFFDTAHDDYFTDDLNVEDIKFIIWQVCSRFGQQKGIFYSPYSQIHDLLGPEILDILVDCYDDAPVSTALADFVTRALRSDDYIRLRTLGLWLNVFNPLVAVPDKPEELLYGGADIQADVKRNNQQLPDDIGYYQMKAMASWADATGMLGIPTSALLARMARDRGFETTAGHLDSVVKRDISTYAVVRTDRKYVEVADAAQNVYKILKSSFSAQKFHGIKSLMGQIVRYGDDWNINGMASLSQGEAEISDQEEALHYDAKNLERVGRLIDDNDGRQVICCSSLRQLSKVLQLPLQLQDDNLPDDMKDADNYVVVLSREKGYYIIPDYAECISDPKNRLFRKRKAEKRSLDFIAFTNMPDDVAKYVADNHLLSEASFYTSQGGDLGLRTVQDNLRFLFGFYRTKPAKLI